MSALPQGQPAMPPQGASPPGQPPQSIGSSPATMPLPNKGQEAAGLARLGVIVKLMQESVPLLPISSEPAQDLLQCLQKLSKHVPPGAVSPGVEQSSIARLAAQQRQNGPNIAAMRAQSAQSPPPAPAVGGPDGGS